jgi:toxin-antitoxin system PIN domain toxin
VSRPALLDVNILLALFHAEHEHHEVAHDWFSDHREDGWATCPLTENGFVRIASNPASMPVRLRPPEILENLRKFCASGHHVFWPDSISLRDSKLFNQPLVSGHRHLTDLYLLGLAKKMGGKLATFDQSIPLGAVVGATRATIAVLSADGDAA